MVHLKFTRGTRPVHVLPVPSKHPAAILLRSTKSGGIILPGGGKMVLCHKLFTFESPYRRKIRRFKTVLVV